MKQKIFEMIVSRVFELDKEYYETNYFGNDEKKIEYIAKQLSEEL